MNSYPIVFISIKISLRVFNINCFCHCLTYAEHWNVDVGFAKRTDWSSKAKINLKTDLNLFLPKSI